jgi:hypothetical protein
MNVKQIVFISLFIALVSSCSNSNPSKVEPETIEKTLEIIPSGKEEVQELLDYFESNKLKINKTTKAELSMIYDIEENDYYMNKKVQLEDHVLYINFTISNDVLVKVSFATLSNSPKDFSYITNLITQHFGESYTQNFNTNDSVVNNATLKWELDSAYIQYETFSDLNSGYEITIK